MTKINKTEQTGRSMVEMLGVLAVIGVLSITGISGYTTAMNKHKANQILDAASKRAVAVSTQIQRGNTNPTLAEFEDNKVGGAEFSTNYTPIGTNRFKIAFTSGPDPDVLAQIKSIVGTDGIVRDIDGGFIYNNDLTTDAIAGDYKDSTSCGTYATTGQTWCSKLGTSGQCVEGNDCCTGITTSTCLICDSSTGEITKPDNTTSCKTTSTATTDDGKCDGNGVCEKLKVFHNSTDLMTYSDAVTYCQSKGMRLLQPEDKGCTIEEIETYPSTCQADFIGWVDGGNHCTGENKYKITINGGFYDYECLPPSYNYVAQCVSI